MRTEQIGDATAADAALPIALRSISKSFAGIKVVSDVSFDMRPGEVHALMGENGAGKSTLIKVMAGLYQPDEGQILVNGSPIRFPSPKDAHAAGIATVHQELLLFPELTVAENIFLGQTPKTALGTIDWTTMRRRARELLDELDSGDLDIDQKVAHLSVGNRQRIEIARALSKTTQKMPPRRVKRRARFTRARLRSTAERRSARIRERLVPAIKLTKCGLRNRAAGR